MMFQFPSNGKVYPKRSRYVQRTTHRIRWVSIPFKREGVYKVENEKVEKLFNPGFNSLQTGRCIQREIFLLPSRQFENVSIPFKREGVYKAGEGSGRPRRQFRQVSIPFKREGVYKVGELPLGGESYRVSIPFKREGISQGVPCTRSK